MKFFLKSLQNIDNLVSYILSNNAKEDSYLKNIFNKKKVICFDVGANLGGYSNFIKRNLIVKYLHMFEPSVECFEYLRNNYNNKNTTIVNAAITTENKKRYFYENEILSQSSLNLNKNKFNKNYNYKNKYKVKCINLDTYYKGINGKFIIDILKIDAEGEDLNVLKGCKQLLYKKKIKIIKIELLNSIRKNKSNILEIINFLSSYNYFINTIVKSKFENNRLLMMDTYFISK